MIISIIMWSSLILLGVNLIGQIYLDILVRGVYKGLLTDKIRRFHWKKIQYIYQNENRAVEKEKNRIKKIRWLNKIILYTMLVLFIEYGIWMILNW